MYWSRPQLTWKWMCRQEGYVFKDVLKGRQHQNIKATCFPKGKKIASTGNPFIFYGIHYQRPKTLLLAPSFFMEDLSRKCWCEKLQIIQIPLMQKRDVSGQKTAREESTSHLDMKEVEDLPGRDWRERGHSGAPTTWHQASVSPGCCPRDASATVAVWQSLFWMVAFPSGNPF